MTNQVLRRFAAKTAAPLGLLLLTFGCGGGGGRSGPTSPTPPSTPGVLQPNVAALPADGSVTFSNVTPNSITLNGAIPSLKPGMVIAGGPAPGVMRKVVSASRSGSSETVQTTYATLTDVFQQASIQFSGPVILGTATSTAPGITITDAPSSSIASKFSAQPASASNLFSKAIKFDNVHLTPPSASAGVTLNGSATIGMSVNCDIEIDTAHNLDYVQFIPTITGSASVEARADATVTLPSADIDIAQITCPPIPLGLIGRVPVWVTPEVDLHSTADGQITAGVDAVSTGTVSIGTGGPKSSSYGIECVWSVGISVYSSIDVVLLLLCRVFLVTLRSELEI